MIRDMLRVVRRLIKTTMVLIFSVTVVPASMLAIALAIVLFTPVPVTIPKPKTQDAVRPSFVYDSNGRLLTVFRKVESNIPVKPKDIPKVLRQALVAAEDRRFYTHSGVDFKGLARAAKRDIETGEAEQGASTITQQLVKNVYYPDETTELVKDTTDSSVARGINKVWRKLRIAVIANRLDRKLSKEDILFQYMNNIFLGNGAYGVGAASQTYFRKNVKDLTLSEAATIAGIIPAPSKYEPRGSTRNAEVKRRITLRQMRELAMITELQYQEALEQELWVDSDGPPPVGKKVTLVFGQQVFKTEYPYFVDYVRRYLESRYGDAVVYGGGLQIRTTLDPILQDAAEKTSASVLNGTRAGLEMSIVSVEPLTGFVKALVGGRDFYAPGGQVNLGLGDCPTPDRLNRLLKGSDPKLPPTCNGRNYVDGGGSGRSPGSSIKPIVLAEAFRQGIPQTQEISGAIYKYKGERIRNFEGASYGTVNLRSMTIRSVNTAYARLGYDLVGIENVAKMAQRLGITSAWYDAGRHGPSYALGGIDVSPLEMAAAYSVFAGRGMRAPATPILTVTDADGKVLEDNLERKPRRVLSQTVADNVTDVLKAAVSEGTGKRAQLGDRPVAGKTGTSQGYGNAWFVGYTPTLSTAVWMGYRDSLKPLRGIRGFGSVAGGTIPAATFARYMRVALKGIPPTQFDEPAPIVRPKKLSAKEIIQQKAREGIDLGPRRPVGGTAERAYVESLRPPAVGAPPMPDETATFPTLPPAQVPIAPPPTTPGGGTGDDRGEITPLPPPAASSVPRVPATVTASRRTDSG